ncbi:MAG TPA: aminotransferase class I/II-fold pyridoxal phosphate-dependent enzyme [Kiritimatiellae bacterium]|nr:aminotransferase class I/II-fold pyridoxal phosphate-dependent enzyme [Kiritimatiellia bacterium]
MRGLRSRRSRVAEHVLRIPRSGIRDFFDIVSQRQDVISLSIGEPDFDAPWHVREAAIFALEKGATHYTSNRGLLRLREAVSRYVERNFALQYDPETEILVTVGVSEAVDLALRAILSPGDEVIYHEPAYVSYAPLTAIAHGRPRPVVTRMEDEFRLRPEAIRRQLSERTQALLLNFPNNPTGAELSADDLRGIARVAEEEDLIIITDEIYAELTYDQAHTTIASLPGMKQRAIFLHGFSKGWAMTGFRIGYACGPAELIEAMMKIHQYSMLCAPVLAQEAAIGALLDGLDDVEQMRNEYRRRRNFLLRSFAQMGLRCVVPRGAFYSFPYVGELGLSSRDFALRLLEEESVAVVPGTAFGTCGEGFVRCAFATAMEEIEEATERMGAFVARYRKAGA